MLHIALCYIPVSFHSLPLESSNALDIVVREGMSHDHGSVRFQQTVNVQRFARGWAFSERDIHLKSSSLNLARAVALVALSVHNFRRSAVEVNGIDCACLGGVDLDGARTIACLCDGELKTRAGSHGVRSVSLEHTDAHFSEEFDETLAAGGLPGTNEVVKCA